MRLNQVLDQYQGLERRHRANAGADVLVDGALAVQRLRVGGEAMAVIMEQQGAANDNQEGVRVSMESWGKHGMNAVGEEAKFLQWAIYKVKALTGIDVSGVEVTDTLSEGVLGQYGISSKKITVAKSLLGQHGLLMHVLLHEALHATLRKNGESPNLDRDLEEGLVERVATELTKNTGEGNGRSIAYAREQVTANAVVAAVGLTWREVQAALLSGDQEDWLQAANAYAQAA